MHADSEYWLPDLGTGSYVSRDLHWYRSTLAHNAPRLDGESQPREDATCENFDRSGDWAWARGRFGPLTRTVVAGPRYLLDVVELAGTEERYARASLAPDRPGIGRASPEAGSRLTWTTNSPRRRSGW